MSRSDRFPVSSRWLVPLLALVLVPAGFLVAGQLRLLPDLENPFATRTEDRTGPAVLESLRDMSRYEGASGTFQVVVDLEKDAKFLPDAVRGSRTLFVGTGSVGAYVDLGGLDEDAVTVTEDRAGATVRLPRARLEKPALDVEGSYAVTKERGLLDRLGDVFSDNPGDEREVHRIAVERIGAAAEESGLVERAERNTREMLENLLRSLGFEEVSVSFAGGREGRG
ncbi:DUF4230 domain-containing protein [Streptomyces sp. TRM43335]|uniref:DUF4230 domain-containing protein n=1 Tax=Streptomyces taklimakanensis TaxID=2569853 RepID=A0A6G2B7X8_9ACTN|nr:DUF4230 domain-containing protein [Streptomyces taklimakanensis]MTE18012.1 DUF4230 domain-containing protein [Streptomyces taklimakanensis]